MRRDKVLSIYDMIHKSGVNILVGFSGICFVFLNIKAMEILFSPSTSLPESITVENNTTEEKLQ